MPCQECAGLHVELLTLKEFMAQWFNILMKKIEVVEKQNNMLAERMETGGSVGGASGFASTSPKQRNEHRPKPRAGRPAANPPAIGLPPTSTAATANATSSLNDRINYLVSRAAQQQGGENSPTSVSGEGDGNQEDNKIQHDPMRLFPSMAFTAAADSTKESSDQPQGDNDHDDLVINTNAGTVGSVHFANSNDVHSLAAALNGIVETEDEVSTLFGKNSFGDDGESDNGMENGSQDSGDTPLAQIKSSSTKREANEKEGTPPNVAIMSGPNKFTCRLCRSHFTQMSNLRRHVRVIHQGLTKHACRYCGKVFAWKGAWRRHEQFVHELRGGSGE